MATTVSTTERPAAERATGERTRRRKKKANARRRLREAEGGVALRSAHPGSQRRALRLCADGGLGVRFRAGSAPGCRRAAAQRGLTNNDNGGTALYLVLSSTPSFGSLGRQPGDTFARNPFVP